MFEDDELELGDVVGVDPVFSGLAYEILLCSTCGTVTLGRITSGADKIVEAGQGDNEGIVVVLEEGFRFQSRGKRGSEMPAGLFVMLLDDLLEASIVELCVLGQVMHVGNDVAQVLLQEQEVFLQLGLTSFILCIVQVPLLFDNLADFCLAIFDARDDLAALELLEGKNLVQLGLEQLDESLFVVFAPRAPLWLGRVLVVAFEIGSFEGLLQLIVGDVVPVVVFDQRRAELLAEPVVRVSSGTVAKGGEARTSCLLRGGQRRTLTDTSD